MATRSWDLPDPRVPMNAVMRPSSMVTSGTPATPVASTRARGTAPLLILPTPLLVTGYDAAARLGGAAWAHWIIAGAYDPSVELSKMDDDLGPHARDVERLIDRLHRLREGELLRLAAFGDRSTDPDHRAVYDSIGGRVKAARRQRAVENGRDLLRRWVSWRKQLAAPDLVVSVADLTSDARRQALPAAYDAMVGYVARDLLTAEEFDFLTAPWREVSGGRTR